MVDWLNKLEDVRSTSGGGTEGLAGTIEKVLLLPVIAFFLQLANALEALLNVFIIPVQSLISGASGFLDSLFNGVSMIISSGARGSANQVELFGIVAFPLGVAIALTAGVVIAYYTRQRFTSDALPFTSTDLPIIGNDEGEE